MAAAVVVAAVAHVDVAAVAVIFLITFFHHHPLMDIPFQLEDKEDELDGMKLRLEEAESRNAQLESKIRMQRSLESIKWEEFEKLATTMKSFSRNMSPSKHDKDMAYD